MSEEKLQRIFEYIHKIAQKQGIDYQSAYNLKIVKMYIEYVEQDKEIIG